MKFIALLVALLVPATVSAQLNTSATSAALAPALLDQAASTQAPQRTPPPPPPPDLRRRRPSMVGYIDDGTVRSQIRLRFDSAYDNSLPDRSEFFYAKCGCYKGLAQAIPPAYDPNAPGPGPGVPTQLNFQQLYVTAEYAPTARFSVFGEIPARWIQPQAFQPIPPFAPFSNQSGLGDIRAGVKVGIVSTDTSGLTAQVRAYFPSGDPAKGLGTDHTSIEPTLLYYQRLGDRVALESQFGAWLPTGGSAGVPTAVSDKFSGAVISYGIGPSFEVYRSSMVRFAPVVELVGWNVRGGFATQPGGPVSGAAQDAAGTNIVNLKVGARVVWADRSAIYVGYGRSLTDAMWYKDIVRLEYRYSF